MFQWKKGLAWLMFGACPKTRLLPSGKKIATALCWLSTSPYSHSLTQSCFFDQVSIPLEPTPDPVVGYRQC